MFAAVLAHILNPITSAIVNCEVQRTYFNNQDLMCSFWPGFLIEFQFVVVSVLLGPRKKTYYTCLIIPFSYICTGEMIKTGQLVPFEIFKIFGAAFSLPTKEVVGALVAISCICVLIAICKYLAEPRTP